MIKIAVPGVNGRMGSAVAEQVLQSDDLELAVATVRVGNPLVGNKLGPINITDNLSSNKFDILIDFTLPDAAIEHLNYCVKHRLPIVIGATGFTPEQLTVIEQAANEIPIVLSANMSIGVNICYKLLAMADKLFDPSWQVSISDVHHVHKKDSPSGTAKHMAKIIARENVTINSERRGEIIGEHTVIFSSKTEQVSIEHISKDRNIYALGALSAARWLVNQKPGLYSMQDVITTQYAQYY